MQLFAFDSAGAVSAAKAQKSKNYLCPECGAQVRIRGGPSRQLHFYHISAPKKCRQHQKSLEHLHLQLKLFELIGANHAIIECPFPEIQRIADVAWQEKKIVFEVQCSPMSLMEAQSRVHDYKSMGYDVVWILHDKQFNRTNLSASESFLRTTPCYFTNSDKMGSGIIYDQFEVFKNAKRIFKGPKLPISPTKIFQVPETVPPDIPLPQAIHERLSSWKRYAHGDLLHRLLKEGNLSQAAAKMLFAESQRERKEVKKLPLGTLISKIYRSLIGRILSVHDKNK